MSQEHTDKKENQIFLIYKEIQSGAVAKSYVRKGFLIYEEMRKYFPIYKEAVSHIWLCNCSILNFLIYEENLIFFFVSAVFVLVLAFKSIGMFTKKYVIFPPRFFKKLNELSSLSKFKTGCAAFFPT